MRGMEAVVRVEMNGVMVGNVTMQFDGEECHTMGAISQDPTDIQGFFLLTLKAITDARDAVGFDPERLIGYLEEAILDVRKNSDGSSKEPPTEDVLPF